MNILIDEENDDFIRIHKEKGILAILLIVFITMISILSAVKEGQH